MHCCRRKRSVMNLSCIGTINKINNFITFARYPIYFAAVQLRLTFRNTLSFALNLLSELNSSFQPWYIILLTYSNLLYSFRIENINQIIHAYGWGIWIVFIKATINWRITKRKVRNSQKAHLFMQIWTQTRARNESIFIVQCIIFTSSRCCSQVSSVTRQAIMRPSFDVGLSIGVVCIKILFFMII